MRRRSGRGDGRLGRLETLGAWLRVWTPPRDVVVPPVPVRGLAIAGLLAIGALAGIAAYAVPRIDRSKEGSQARDRRATARERALERQRALAEQRPVHVRLRRPAGEVRVRSRRRLLAAAESAITADARRRARTGALKGPVLRTRCTPAPASIARRGAERDLRLRRDAYDCLAVTRKISATGSSGAGELGYSYRAVIDFVRARLALCKVSLPPGEGAIPDPRHVQRLPRACRPPRP